eukprot:Nitzschia sp. Nitz4//scaffold45_size130396//178//1658//NITZ4_003424-RA/size130396-processed-gene-0.206-mRNA-1//-1//CDS//3329552323//5595//frame0
MMIPSGRSKAFLLSLAVTVIHSDAFLPVSFVLRPSFTMQSRQLPSSLESAKNPSSFLNTMIDRIVNQDVGVEGVGPVQHEQLTQTGNIAASQQYMKALQVVGGATAESTSSQVYNGVIERSNEIQQLQQTLDPEQVKHLQALRDEQIRAQNLVSRMWSRVKGMSTYDKLTTFALPTLLVLFLGRYFISQLLLQSSLGATEFERRFAVEISYFSGDFEELDLCLEEYRRKMGWLRWRRRKPYLFQKYLAEFIEKTVLRPKDLRSVLYVMDLFQYDNAKLSEELLKLAGEKLDLVALDKILFLSRCLLGGDEAFAPTIKTLHSEVVKGLARDELEPSMLNERQRSLAEDGYGAEVREAGKGQKTKLSGWKLVGLTAAESDRIFMEQKDNQEVYENRNAWKFDNGTVVPDDYDGGEWLDRLQEEQDRNKVDIHEEEENSKNNGQGDE